MQPRVEIAHGTAYDVLLAAAAVADPVWRDAFDAGAATFELVRSTVGADATRRIAAYGRFGWINLVSLRPAGSEAWTVAGLAEAIEHTDAHRLHTVMLGGDRRQLVQAVGESLLERAVTGDPAAREAVTAALASDSLVIAATPDLMQARSADVRADLADLVHTWQQRVLPSDAEATLAASLSEQADEAARLLAATPGRDYLDATIGGLHYDPEGLDRVVSVSLDQVAPIVVVVDGVRETVILHPPVRSGPAVEDSSDRLLHLARAVGDRTRLQVLTRLLDGPLTAVDLARAMDAPRTTLLHHLAILRAAGLVHVTVTPGNATVYRLRPQGFADLAGAAEAFIPTR